MNKSKISVKMNKNKNDYFVSPLEMAKSNLQTFFFN